jgi:uncharacterized membrane-anchored protein
MKKITSRKFIAWLVWTAIVITLITKGQVTDTVILWYGVITSVYIGSNVAMDHIYTQARKEQNR